MGGESGGDGDSGRGGGGGGLSDPFAGGSGGPFIPLAERPAAELPAPSPREGRSSYAPSGESASLHLSLVAGVGDGPRRQRLRLGPTQRASIDQLRPLVARIRGRDKKLASQIVDAANSVVRSLGEGAFSDPGNRRARYHTAAGSASEVRVGLRAAEAWDYLTPSQSLPPLQNLDNLLAVLWKLTR